MTDDDTAVEEALSYLRVVEAVGGVIITVWMLWAYVVPVAVKIDLRAWWNERTMSHGGENRRAIVELHSALMEIELATEHELTAAVERLAS